MPFGRKDIGCGSSAGKPNRILHCRSVWCSLLELFLRNSCGNTANRSVSSLLCRSTGFGLFPSWFAVVVNVITRSFALLLDAAVFSVPALFLRSIFWVPTLSILSAVRSRPLFPFAFAVLLYLSTFPVLSNPIPIHTFVLAFSRLLGSWSSVQEEFSSLLSALSRFRPGFPVHQSHSQGICLHTWVDSIWRGTV